MPFIKLRHSAWYGDKKFKINFPERENAQTRDIVAKKVGCTPHAVGYKNRVSEIIGNIKSDKIDTQNL